MRSTLLLETCRELK